MAALRRPPSLLRPFKPARSSSPRSATLAVRCPRKLAHIVPARRDLEPSTRHATHLPLAAPGRPATYTARAQAPGRAGQPRRPRTRCQEKPDAAAVVRAAKAAGYLDRVTAASMPPAAMQLTSRRCWPAPTRRSPFPMAVMSNSPNVATVGAIVLHELALLLACTAPLPSPPDFATELTRHPEALPLANCRSTAARPRQPTVPGAHRRMIDGQIGQSPSARTPTARRRTATLTRSRAVVPLRRGARR